MSTNSSEFKEGTVKFFNTTKLYGFIKEIGSNNEYFFHKSDMSSLEVQTGDHVEFSLTETPRGMKAVNVSII